MAKAGLAQKGDAATERLVNLTNSLIRELQPNSEAFAFALEILAALNQTETCGKCRGSGGREKHQGCHHDVHDSYVLGCYSRVQCRECHGIGRVPIKAEAAQPADAKRP